MFDDLIRKLISDYDLYKLYKTQKLFCYVEMSINCGNDFVKILNFTNNEGKFEKKGGLVYSTKALIKIIEA